MRNFRVNRAEKPVGILPFMPSKTLDTDAMFHRARRLCLSYWKELRRLRKVVLEQWDRDDIHDLRVASRRFRAVLNLLRPLCDVKGSRRLAGKVRSLTALLGTLRNLDEAALFLEENTTQFDMSAIIGRLHSLRADEQSAVSKVLKSFKPREFNRIVRKITAEMTEKNLAARKKSSLPIYLADVSIDRFGAIQTFMSAALCCEKDEQLHELRIAIKKWRYLVEIASQILDSNADDTVAQLKKYQSLLGQLNDLRVFKELCAETVNSSDEQAAVEHLIALEHDRLLKEFTALAVAEPLNYSFKI